MFQLKKHIESYLLLAVFCAVCTSCDKMIDLHDVPLCDYTAKLRYEYNMENTSNSNRITTYIKSLDEYIFNEQGVLYSIGHLTIDPCTGEWVSQNDLPVGRYSVVALGNLTSMSDVSDNLASLVVGVTRCDDVMMSLVNRSAMSGKSAENEYFDNCSRLFYGYRTFAVEPTGVSDVRVDMVHSHLEVRYIIRWKGDRAPKDSKDFFLLLKDVPSQYRMTPEWIYSESGVCEPRDAGVHDPYQVVDQSVRHYIMKVEKDQNIITHRIPATMFGKTVTGQTISYRIRNPAQGRTMTTISLWRNSATRSGESEMLMKEIPLNDFLSRSGINLDQTLKQFYELVFEIDPYTGSVVVGFADVADWDDGGNLGG